MSKYTAEQVESLAQGLEKYGLGGTTKGASSSIIYTDAPTMLREYAALLRERESVKPVAWLDMGKGEAQLVFSKKAQSNRAAKKEAIRLFESIPEGYHPLFLHPLMQSAKAAVTDEMVSVACVAYLKAPPGHMPDEMRAALEAVAPMLASARVPEYVAAMGDAAEAYLKRVAPDAHRLPATMRWQELYEAMLAAAPKPEKE